jgi:hypothetical protein
VGDPFQLRAHLVALKPVHRWSRCTSQTWFGMRCLVTLCGAGPIAGRTHLAAHEGRRLSRS